MSGSRDEKRARIIGLAIKAIARHGVKKTTIEDIADASGLAPTSIYYYFPSKKELLRAALSSLLDTGLDDIEKVARSACPVEEKLVSTWKILIKSGRDKGVLRNLDRKGKSQLMAFAEDFVDVFTKRHKALVKEILIEGEKKGVFHMGDLEMTATFLSSGVWGLLLNIVELGKIDLTEDWIDELGKLLLHGLMKR
jgi:AcrR family transcriptional regulator